MTNEIILEPNFQMPPDLANARYKEVEEADESYDPDLSEEVDEESDVFSGADDDESYDESSEIYPPDWMIVESRTVRTLPGGGQVVDVVIELPDLDDGDRYEVKVSK